MSAIAPRIGFDRFIDIKWLSAAISVRAGASSLDDLSEVLEESGLGMAAKKKTQTVLNRLWLAPRSDLVEFADRGIGLFMARPQVSPMILSWGMAIATYPFFGHAAELVGRLTGLQGDCASSEIHRRMSEQYGEREGTYRMTNMVLQSQANWGVIKRSENGKRVVRCEQLRLTDNFAIEWLIEAALRYKGRPVSLQSLQTMPVIFPFCLDQSVAYIASKSSTLELRSEASNDRFVDLRSAELRNRIPSLQS